MKIISAILGPTCALALALVASPVTAPSIARADGTTWLRFASLAPRGSFWDKGFRAWNNSLKKETGGRLGLRFYPGTQGGELDYIRKMKAGQLDGAVMTTTGLAKVVRPVTVLSSPGIFEDFESITRVREQLSQEFTSEFEKAGFTFLGWGDVGRARIFSNRPIKRPSDMKSARVWSRRGSATFEAMFDVVGAKGQVASVREVLPGLQTGRIDAFMAPALAAVSLQWHNHVKYVTKQANAVIIGATLLKKSKFDGLQPDLQAALLRTGKKMHAILAKKVKRADERAYKAVVKRGVKVVDISSTESEWKKMSAAVRKRLAGKVYSADLLKRVEKIALE